MQLARAQELATEVGMKLVLGIDYEYDLSDTNSGKYIDSLNPIQIGEMDEEDFKAFYLQDNLMFRDTEEELKEMLQ